MAPEDWVESNETVYALRATAEAGALLATERMALLGMGWHPPSARQVRCMRSSSMFLVLMTLCKLLHFWQASHTLGLLYHLAHDSLGS